MSLAHLHWPFFEPRHREFAQALDAWAATHVRDRGHGPGDDVDATCRALVRELGAAGWLTHAVGEQLDTRLLCLTREVLARHEGLADFAFAMQGLGSGAISLAGTPAQRQRWLPAVARGECITAFALSEPEAGSDVAALQCAARVEGDHAVIDGEKTWISNGGIADLYVVFCRTGEAPGEGTAGAAPWGAGGIWGLGVVGGWAGVVVGVGIVVGPRGLGVGGRRVGAEGVVGGGEVGGEGLAELD
ncbi:MAG: acyl-CoA dehydrogenase family protein, partial [Betaproteobacteria bacterium]